MDIDKEYLRTEPVFETIIMAQLMLLVVLILILLTAQDRVALLSYMYGLASLSHNIVFPEVARLNMAIGYSFLAWLLLPVSVAYYKRRVARILEDLKKEGMIVSINKNGNKITQTFTKTKI